MPQTFLLRCDATQDVALGHLRRCLSLVGALGEQGDSKIGFACYDDTAAHQLLDDAGYTNNWLADLIGTGPDLAETVRIAKDMGADAIILDSYKVSIEYFAAMKDTGLRTIYFEDMLDTECAADVVINGLIGAENINYTAPIKLLGPDYLVLGPDYWDGAPAPAPAETGDATSILITTGGIDHYNLSSRALAQLNDYEKPLLIHIVIGQYFDNVKNIEAAIKACRHDVTLHHQPDGIADIIQKCQIAVSAGGITLYELAAFGVATVGIWLWENQRENVERLGRTGALLPLAYDDGEGFDETMYGAIKNLLDDPKLCQCLGQKGRSVIDGSGARRVADALMNLPG